MARTVFKVTVASALHIKTVISEQRSKQPYRGQPMNSTFHHTLVLACFSLLHTDASLHESRSHVRRR